MPYSVTDQCQRRCLLVSTRILPNGSSKKALVCARDITQIKNAEAALCESVQQLKSALREKITLLQEVHHRVKNNLAVVSSLLSMQARSTPNHEAKRVLEQSQLRVRSMFLVHEHLYRSDQLDRVNFANYAEQLVQGLRAVFLDGPGRVAVETNVDPIELPIEQAVPCGLILNELLSNSFKYAFPDGRTGRVVVSFHKLPDGMLELEVYDDGIGLPGGLPSNANTNSLGLQIVGILVKQLDGALEQESRGGTRMTVCFPIRTASGAVMAKEQKSCA